jgi:hypothetical protein
LCVAGSARSDAFSSPPRLGAAVDAPSDDEDGVRSEFEEHPDAKIARLANAATADLAHHFERCEVTDDLTGQFIGHRRK